MSPSNVFASDFDLKVRCILVPYSSRISTRCFPFFFCLIAILNSFCYYTCKFHYTDKRFITKVSRFYFSRLNSSPNKLLSYSEFFNYFLQGETLFTRMVMN